MIPISIVYSGFIIVVLLIVYYSIRNINSFYEEITYGGGLEQKHYKYIILIHIGIVVYSAIILLIFNYNKTIFSDVSLKPFFINLLTAGIGLLFIFIIFHIQKYYVQKYLKHIYVDSYKDLQEDDEDVNFANEYDEKNISARYNKIISSVVLQLLFVYLLIFLFPITGMEEKYIPENPGAKYSVSQSVVEAAKNRYGENYLLELAKIRRNYIKKHGITKWNEYFAWQIRSEDLSEADSRLELRDLEKEISDLTRDIEFQAQNLEGEDNIQNLFEELYEEIDLSTIFSFEEEEDDTALEEESSGIKNYDNTENPFWRLYE